MLAPAPLNRLNPRGAQDSEKKGITRERLRFLRRWVLHSYSSQRSQVGFLTHARGDSESDESESESEGGDDSEEGSPGLDNTKYGRIFNIILIRIIRNTWSSQV